MCTSLLLWTDRLVSAVRVEVQLATSWLLKRGVCMHIARLTKYTTSPRKRQITAAYKGGASARALQHMIIARSKDVKLPQGQIYGTQRSTPDDHSEHDAPAGCMTASIVPIQSCMYEALFERRGGHLICHHAQG